MADNNPSQNWFSQYMQQLQGRPNVGSSPGGPQPWQNLLLAPVGQTYAPGNDGSQPTNGFQNPFLDQSFQQLLDSLKSNQSAMPSSADILQQAQRQANATYDPQIAAIQRAMSNQKTTAAKNKGELQSLYGGLANSYGPEAKAAKAQNATAKKNEAAQFKATQQDLANQDAQVRQQQEKELARLGVQSALPETLKGQDEGASFLDKLMAQQSQAQQQSLDLLGSGDQSYYQQGRGIAQLTGNNAVTDLMSQLNQYLQGASGDISTLQGQKAAAIQQLQQQLQSSAASEAQKQQASNWDNLFKLMQFYAGQQNNGAGSIKSGMTGAQQLAQQFFPGNGLSNQFEQSKLAGSLVELLNQKPFIAGQIPGPNGTSNRLTPEAAGNLAQTYASQQGMTDAEKKAFYAMVMAYYGRG